jgi:Ca2+/H+ antiporter
MRVLAAMLTSPLVWKIHTSFAPPEIVTLVGMVIVLVHLYRPGTSAHFEGIILCKTDVTLVTGATMTGRILSQTAVVLQKAVLRQPAQ